MTIRVRWRDGHVTEAGSWTWLLRKVRRDAWNLPYRRTPAAMRSELARRAYVWSGEIVDPTLPAPQFWRALADTELIRLEVTRDGQD